MMCRVSGMADGYVECVNDGKEVCMKKKWVKVLIKVLRIIFRALLGKGRKKGGGELVGDD